MHAGATLIAEDWCKSCKWPEHRLWRVAGNLQHETVSCRCCFGLAFMGEMPAGPTYLGSRRPDVYEVVAS